MKEMLKKANCRMYMLHALKRFGFLDFLEKLVYCRRQTEYAMHPVQSLSPMGTAPQICNGWTNKAEVSHEQEIIALYSRGESIMDNEPNICLLVITVV